MAIELADRTLETTTVAGTGTATLLGAQFGYQSFSNSLTNGATTYYTIVDNTNGAWEVGTGTYNANTLARTTVLDSSNSGSLVYFAAGTKDIFIDLPSEVIMAIGGSVTSVNGYTGTVVLTAADVSAIPYTGATGAVDLNAKTLVNVANLGINTTTVPTIRFRAVGDNGGFSRIAMRGYSSDANSSSIRVSKFRGTSGAPQAPISGDSLGKFELAGYGTTASEAYPQVSLEGVTTEIWGATARGAKAVIKVTPNTTITQVTAVTVDQDSKVTLAGALAVTGTTTLATSLSGLAKLTAGVVSTATSGTDYAPATSGSSILYGNGSGGFSNVTIGTNLTFSAGTLNATGGGGMVYPGAGIPNSTGSAWGTSYTTSGTGTVLALATGATIDNATIGSVTRGSGAFTTISLTNSLATQSGGTGINTGYTVGDMLYSNVTNGLAKLAIGTSGQVLSVTAGVPAWTTVSGTGTVTSVAMTVPTFLSIAGSPITTTGTLAVTLSGTALPVANGGTGATTLTGVVIGNGTSAFTTVTAPSGAIVGTTDTQTLTNKRVTPRVSTTTSSATPTINSDNVDMYGLTAQAVDITSFTTNLSGTPTDGQKLWIYIVGTAARAITWGAKFESSTATLPTTTVTTNRIDVGFVWNAVASVWRCVAVA